MSLVEVMVSIGILLFVVILTGDYIASGFRTTTFADEQTKAIKNARKALESVAIDLREARRSERGDYPLTRVDSQDFSWYGDIDNDDTSEKIRYFKQGMDLVRVVTEPDAGNNYVGPVSTTTIAQHINNQTEAIFIYLDGNNTETSIINQIRMINISLKVNVTPERAPADYYVETDINLRNLKDNL